MVSSWSDLESVECPSIRLPNWHQLWNKIWLPFRLFSLFFFFNLRTLSAGMLHRTLHHGNFVIPPRFRVWLLNRFWSSVHKNSNLSIMSHGKVCINLKEHQEICVYILFYAPFYLPFYLQFYLPQDNDDQDGASQCLGIPILAMFCMTTRKW